MPIIVQKYGGSSVDGHEKLLSVAQRVAALKRSGYDVVVVVSAQGGTTDSLLAEARLLTPEPAQRELDMLMTAGERMSMSLLAIALNSIGCPAVSFTGSQVGIITDTRHTNARILEVRPHRVVKEIEKGSVVVVGGFQGVSTAKEVTTLGRGGSDTTAVALAAALGAESCEILTDTDAVYTADPRKVPGARRIKEISYDDMAELARSGATVLAEEAVRFAEREGISINVGASSRDTPGTIVLEEPAARERPVVGLSVLPNVNLVTWENATLASVAPDVASLGRSVRFIAALGDHVRAVCEREGPDAASPRACRGASVHPADLVCLTGPEAGSAATAAAVAGSLATAGHEILAAAASGRSTVLAVHPGAGDDVLKRLHAFFFPPDAAR